MKLVIPKENIPNEFRVALTPEYVKKLVSLGVQICIETGLGTHIQISDKHYLEAGATIIDKRSSLMADADMVMKINKPTIDDIKLLKKGAILISNLNPFNEKELIECCVAQGIHALSMELIPRSTRAQKMDVLSSQANLVGYAMVILAAQRLKKILPMMITPAGTISPARVFIIGAGVAGLQAIATAKRLGARVEAFDTREVVAEQIESLGAKFVKIDLGETGQTKNGYAKALTNEQIEKQRKGLAKVCSYSDIVITTAQIPGKKAPLIITKEMIETMNPGSVIVDMAVSSGGNVELSEADNEIEINGIRIIGVQNLPSLVGVDASKMYAANMFNFFKEFWDQDEKYFNLNMQDDIISNCLITSDGKLCNENIKNHFAQKGE